jgi:hypothetical protein
LSTTASGLAAAVFGAYLWFLHDGSTSPGFYAGLLVSASLLWVGAALLYSSVQEEAGETQGGGNAFFQALQRLDLLRTDCNFRRFVISRTLFLCSALSAPYYVVLSQETQGIDFRGLGMFVLANALASSVSAAFWGIMADVSSKRVLLRAATLAALLGIGVFVVATFDTPFSRWRWTYPAAFFVLGIAHSGVRLGRKTYVVDMAGGNRRTDYVAVSNTAIGAVLLLSCVLGPLAAVITPAGIVLLLSVCGLIGVAVGATLPEVE